jgi:hypothetical protein
LKHTGPTLRWPERPTFHILKDSAQIIPSALESVMKASLIGAAAAALILSGCYYPGPYTYYPVVPATAANIETIPPNSPDAPPPQGAQNGGPDDAQGGQPPAQAGRPAPQGQPQQPPPGYAGGQAYYAYPAYPSYPVYPAYGYPAYGYGYPGYGYPAYGYPVWGGPSVAFGFSFGGGHGGHYHH